MPRKQVKIPPIVVARALAQADLFHTELQYLISAGISRTDIARGIGVSRRQLYEWELGRYAPQQPVLAFVVIYWAEHVRLRSKYGGSDERA